MRKIAFILIALITIAGIASAEPTLTVNPKLINVHLTAGENVTKEITVSWTGDYPIIVFFDMNVKPNSEGMTIYMSQDPINIIPAQTKKVNMTIMTSPALAPGNYTVEIYAISETNKLDELYNITELLKNQLNDLKTKINSLDLGTTAHTELLIKIKNLQDLVNQLELKIDQLEGQTEPVQKESIWMLPIVILLILIFIILLICLRLLLLKKNENGSHKRIDTSDEAEEETDKKEEAVDKNNDEPSSCGNTKETIDALKKRIKEIERGPRAKNK